MQTLGYKNGGDSDTGYPDIQVTISAQGLLGDKRF